VISTFPTGSTPVAVLPKMSADEATVNNDGSSTFEEPLLNNETGGEQIPVDDIPPMDEELLKEVVKGTDPAVYVLLAVVIIAALYYFLVYRKKAAADEGDGFFSNLDGDKVSSVSRPDGRFVLSLKFSDWSLF
jgi:hypothetical protein